MTDSTAPDGWVHMGRLIAITPLPPEPVRLDLTWGGELLELPIGPDQKMWLRVAPEQAAAVREQLAALGPGARFTIEPVGDNADPLAHLIAAMAQPIVFAPKEETVTAPHDRCVFCDRPSETHGQQYSDQVGTHEFTRQRRDYTDQARNVTVPRND